MGKKSQGFMLYYDDLEALNVLTDAQLGSLVRALAAESDVSQVPPDLALAYSILHRKIIRDQQHYEEICLQNKKKIMRRWHPDDTDGYQSIPQYTEVTDGYSSIPTILTETVTVTETTPVINKKNKDDARVREALFEEIKDGYCHGSGTLERKLRKLIDKYGEQKIREIISAGASTIWDLDFRLEHGEATDESAD